MEPKDLVYRCLSKTQDNYCFNISNNFITSPLLATYWLFLLASQFPISVLLAKQKLKGGLCAYCSYSKAGETVENSVTSPQSAGIRGDGGGGVGGEQAACAGVPIP